MNNRREPPAPSRPHLVFADSSRATCDLAVQALGNEFETTTASSLEQAWRTLVEDPAIRVVFLGFDDQKDVIELVERVRSSTEVRIAETPIVQVTSSSVDDSDRQSALAAGVTDFIDKPFQQSMLLARARSTASHSAARLHQVQQGGSHDRDSETGLGNRRYFFERLGQTLSFARRARQSTSLVHVHFEGLTDSLEPLGRHFRTTRMTKVGQTLADAVRREDTIYRTGPEHFSYILPGTDQRGAEALCERIKPLLDSIGMLRGDGILAVAARLEVQHIEVTDDRTVDDCLREVRESMVPAILGGLRPAR